MITSTAVILFSCTALSDSNFFKHQLFNLFLHLSIMFVKVKVKLSSGKQYPKHPKGCEGHKEIQKISEKEYKIYLKSQAENNKANMELLKLLQKYFNTKDIKIKTGFSSRNKLVEVLQIK